VGAVREHLLVGSGKYLHWGVVQISLTNFLIIAGMVVLFVVALLAPFPGGPDRDDSQRVEEVRDGDD
jgi:large-conductance mechanosensitive channel